MPAESRCEVAKPSIPIAIDGYDVKIFTDNIEETALAQIKELLSIDVFSDKKIRIMPDVHAGAGCVIGFTGDLGDKVIPNIVGVDIGCGMRVLNLGKLSEIDFHALNEHIRNNVPSGKIVREDRFGFKPLVGDEMDIYREAKKLVTELYCYREIKDSGRINKSIGSLGGGNHFIELDKDDDNNVYLVIHTGSRNLGKQVADIYQAKAIKHLTAGADEFEQTIKRTIEEYKAAGRRAELQDVIKKMRREHQKAEPSLPAELCYVEGEGREQYLHDMRLCQRWAVLNRKLISLLLLRFFSGVEVKEEFESVHNYISDDNIIRKGSISAAAGERCIIPLNMRDGSLLCTGKGNPDWNCSAPHGAGRVLSRTQAYEVITMEDFEASMKGIYSESVNDFTRDESPMVYKPAEEIIANIGDTVSIDTIIRPIFNFKASK
ncbi:MAG: RtcB family protein [Muribaculaceae bacterium]|nr:RtcB family protein [Muribaculaceae bacterium]